MSIQKSDKQRIRILDVVRGLAIIHIIMYHYYLEWFQGSFLIVPDGVAANLPRVEIFKDGGILGFVKNLFSSLFVYGFSSVNLFLILSGFVLTYSLLKRGDDLGGAAAGLRAHVRYWVGFYWRRLKRILIPFYVSVLIGIGFLYLRNVLFPALAANPAYDWVYVLKVIFVPFVFFSFDVVQKFNGDYWFVPLILQMYLVFPLLYIAMKKTGPWKFIAGVFVITVAYRFAATYFLDTVPMGVIYPAQHSYRLFSFFLPRLFEFGVGMLAAHFYLKADNLLERFSGWGGALAGLFLTLSGYALDCYKWGWVLSDLVAGCGLFILFIALAGFFARSKIVEKTMLFAGRASYETFLLHHYFLNYFLMPLLLVAGLKNELTFWIAIPFYIVVCVLLGEGGRLLSNASVVMISRSDSPA
jgi:peptidoglycan/LPS O-acetylase OafA/YrhL